MFYDLDSNLSGCLYDIIGLSVIACLSMDANTGILINTLGFFSIAWHKTIRRISRLHPRTHSKLFPLICQCMSITDSFCTRLNSFMLIANDSDYQFIRVCTTLAKSGSRSPVSNSFSFSRMLSWNRADIIEDVTVMLYGLIRDFVELKDSGASYSNTVDI